jgi:hypothetical protein
VEDLGGISGKQEQTSPLDGTGDLVSENDEPTEYSMAVPEENYLNVSANACMKQQCAEIMHLTCCKPPYRMSWPVNVDLCDFLIDSLLVFTLGDYQ